MDLVFRYYHTATGAANLYALLYDNAGNALKDIGGGIYAMAAYTAANHGLFDIPLVEDTERTFLYSLTIADAFLTLAATPTNRHYTWEVWDGALKTRSDTLLGVHNLIWSGTNEMDVRIDPADQLTLSVYEAKVGVSYDSALQEIQFLIWMEKNGALVTDPIEGQVTWYDRAGATLLDSTQNTPLVPGVYAFKASLVDLDPDQATFVLVRVQDADGNDHTTGEAIISWD